MLERFCGYRKYDPFTNDLAISFAHSFLVIPTSAAFIPDVSATIVLIALKSSNFWANLNSTFSENFSPFSIVSKNSLDSLLIPWVLLSLATRLCLTDAASRSRWRLSLRSNTLLTVWCHFCIFKRFLAYLRLLSLPEEAIGWIEFRLIFLFFFSI